jgi:uncharacterized phage protein gp47/JayE
VITIITLNEIYNNLKEKFYNKSKIDIKKGTIIDMFFKSIADQLYQVYETIENNKKPYLFTQQVGKELDDTGAFVGITRLDNESDENYLYRLSAWTYDHASCNATAIDNKCKELVYSTGHNYVPYTKGIGTGTIYLIPLSYSEEDIELAINEAVEKVSLVIDPTSRVEFRVPDPITIKLVAYLDVKSNSDKEAIKNQIIYKIKDYINGIAPGEYMYLGEINKLGLSVDGVEYFNVVQVYENDEEATDFEILQTTVAKFLFDQIIWWDVES